MLVCMKKKRAFIKLCSDAFLLVIAQFVCENVQLPIVKFGIHHLRKSRDLIHTKKCQLELITLSLVIVLISIFPNSIYAKKISCKRNCLKWKL